MANAATFGFQWERFQGSRAALKWNRRDLPHLKAVLRRVHGRTACVQAGGNLGIFPKYLARHFRVVHTFEPSAENFAMLCANAPEPNIVRWRCALGDRAGTVGLSKVRRDGKPDSHEGCVHVAGGGAVPMTTIDALRLDACDLLCLDLEGYELYALRGAVETLARCRPVLVLEINKSLGFYGLGVDELTECLASSGYANGQKLGTSSDRLFIPMERAACH